MNAHLTERQIAMLAEMGVAVVRPLARADLAVPAVPPLASRAALPAHQAPAATPERPKTTITPEPTVAPRAPTAMAPEWQALTWQTLQARCNQCQDCQWGQARQRAGWGYFVRGDGINDAAPRADLLIVTEPPDEASDAQGQLLGPPGHPARELLNGMVGAMVQKLADSPTPLHSVFVTSVTKCKPPIGATMARDSIEACRPYLDRSIALLRPAFILALGSVAGRALMLGQTTQSTTSQPPAQAAANERVRGQIRFYQGVPWLASMPVQHLVREPKQKAAAWEDLKLAISYLQTKAPLEGNPPPVA
jgi:uracil-DNA glycosylase family 4